jgi:hypothetical protein
MGDQFGEGATFSGRVVSVFNVYTPPEGRCRCRELRSRHSTNVGSAHKVELSPCLRLAIVVS